MVERFAEEGAELVELEEVALDVRQADVDEKVRDETLPAVGREPLVRGEDDVPACDTHELGDRLDGPHEVLEHLGAEHDVERAVAEGQAGQLHRDGVIELPEDEPVQREIQLVHHVRVEARNAVALGHEVRDVLPAGRDVEEAPELEPVEPAEDLHLAHEPAEVRRGHPARPAIVVVGPPLGIERVLDTDGEPILEPRAGVVLDARGVGGHRRRRITPRGRRGCQARSGGRATGAARP